MSRKVRVGVCVEARAPRMALLETLCESEVFDVIAVAPSRDLFVPLCVPLYPDLVIMGETAAEGAPALLAHQIAQGRRIVPVVLSSGSYAWDPKEVASVSLELLLSSDARARADVQTALFAAATPIMTSKRTLMAGELAKHATSLRERAAGGNVRQDVSALGEWPLDLILLVDDGSNTRRLGSYVAELDTLRVPVLLAVLSDPAEAYSAMKSVAPGVTRTLTGPTSVRRLEGFSIVAADRMVQLSGEDIYVAPGALSIEHLIASMAWLKSGGLSIVMSTAHTQCTAALASVAAGGGLVAVLDPAHCEEPDAARATSEWPAPPLRLSPDELRWVIRFALPRKG